MWLLGGRFVHVWVLQEAVSHEGMRGQGLGWFLACETKLFPSLLVYDMTHPPFDGEKYEPKAIVLYLFHTNSGH